MKVIPMFLLFAMCSVAWGVLFIDDFNRPDGDLGNGWATQTDGTITVKIVNEEVLIKGTQGTDWVRSGLYRPVENETQVQFDFMAANRFNVHVRIDDETTGAYIDFYAPPGGSFSYASSPDGGWPGWTQMPNSLMLGNQYNTVKLVQDGTDFTFILNGNEVEDVGNKNLITITKVSFASDAASGTAGELHIDNVIIGNPETSTQAVQPNGKLATSWASIKDM